MVLIAVLATALAGLDDTATAQDGPRLTGQFLVATDRIRDPRFMRTVIYLVDHDEGGVMGLVINRPAGPVPAAHLLEAFGLDTDEVTGQIKVYYGGPVQPNRGFVLHTSDYSVHGTQVVRDGISVTAGRDILGPVARGKGPRQSLFTLGYAGWAPGQLEGEIRAGAWVTVPGDPALIFDADDSTKWERATSRLKLKI